MFMGGGVIKTEIKGYRPKGHFELPKGVNPCRNCKGSRDVSCKYYDSCLDFILFKDIGSTGFSCFNCRFASDKIKRKAIKFI